MSNDFDFLSALGEHARTVAYTGNARQYVNAVINNLDEVDAILPDSLGRPLVERIRGLLERANREASLAVELRERAESAEARLEKERKRTLEECLVIVRKHTSLKNLRVGYDVAADIEAELLALLGKGKE